MIILTKYLKNRKKANQLMTKQQPELNCFIEKNVKKQCFKIMWFRSLICVNVQKAVKTVKSINRVLRHSGNLS